MKYCLQFDPHVRGEPQEPLGLDEACTAIRA